MSHVTSTMCRLDELIFQTVFISIDKRRHVKRLSSIIKIASHLYKCQFVCILLLSWLPLCHMASTSRHALWHTGSLSSIWATGPLLIMRSTDLTFKDKNVYKNVIDVFTRRISSASISWHNPLILSERSPLTPNSPNLQITSVCYFCNCKYLLNDKQLLWHFQVF